MKTITYKFILPDDGVDQVDETIADYVFMALEGVAIHSEIREATKEEEARYDDYYR